MQSHLKQRIFSRYLNFIAAAVTAVTIAATAATVAASELPTLSFNLDAPSVNEDSGTLTGTVYRNVVTSSPLTVNLAVDDASEASVPASVVIPADAASASFAVSGASDNLLDGTQTVTLAGSAASFGSASTSFDVTDSDTSVGDFIPPASMVIDLTQTPYNLDPTGVADCSAGLQQALNDHSGDWYTRFILYLPNGTYRFSQGVKLDTHDESSADGQASGRGAVLMGQSRDGVILRLDNNVHTDPLNPQVFIDFNESQDNVTWFQAVGFNTGIYQLTINIGQGNSGAIALDFCANNTGGLRDVKITSTSPANSANRGKYGLLLSKIPGPQLFKRLEIDGFDWGIYVSDMANYATTAEYVTLKNCTSGGIYNTKHSFTIRGLVTDNLGGPAIHNNHIDGLITLLDGTFTNGSTSQSALVNEGFMYLRNVQSSGYARALTNRGTPLAGNSISEWFTDSTLTAEHRLFNDAPLSSLNLKIEETPGPVWDDSSNWVSVADYGATPGDFGHDSDAINNAIAAMVAASGPDAGKKTLYFPPAAPGASSGNRYTIDKSIIIPPGIERIVGAFTTLHPKGIVVSADGDPNQVAGDPMFQIMGSGNQLTIEQFSVTGDSRANPTALFSNQSDRDLLLRNIFIAEGKVYENLGNTSTGLSGRLYLEDFAATSLRYWGAGDPQPVPAAIPQFDFGGQDVWARQLNPEQKDLNALNDGGNLWILGWKNEEDGTQVKTINGGQTEIIGGTLMPLDVDSGTDPAYVVEDASLSVVIAGHVAMRPLKAALANYEVLVRETQEADTRELLDGDVTLRRSYTGPAGATPPMLVLYSSHRDAVLGFDTSTAIVNEDDASITLTITRTGSTVGAVSVDYTTVGQSATAGSDYTPVSGTLNWADGDAADKTITIFITNEGTSEVSETLTVKLSNPTPSDDALLGAIASSLVTIEDSLGGLELPQTIAGLVGWYDAQTLSAADGTAISTWVDATGGTNSTANNLTQVTSGVQPEGTNPVAPTLQTVNFNGYGYRALRFVEGAAGDYELLQAPSLVATADSDRTMIFVYEGGVDHGGCRVGGFGSRLSDGFNDARHFNIGTDANGSLRFDGAYNSDHSPSLTRTDMLIRTVVMNSANSFDEYIDVLDGSFTDTQVLSNGVPTNSLGNVVGDFYLGDLQTSSPGGGNGAANFDILEVLVFDSVLSTADRQAVQDYLKVKYTTDPNPLAAPAAPSGLTATTTSSTSIDLAWLDNSGSEDGFIVQQSTTSGGPWTDVATTAADVTSYTATPLAAGTNYYYQIIATSSTAGDSLPSAEVSATTWTAAEAWRDQHFGSIANSGNAADTADPDGDGLVNLLERATGSTPTSALSVYPPEVSIVTDGGSDYLALSYRRLTGGTGNTGIDYTLDDLTYNIEHTTDLLGTWIEGTAGSVRVYGVPQDNLDGTETATVRLNTPIIDEPKYFIRLRITSTP